MKSTYLVPLMLSLGGQKAAPLCALCSESHDVCGLLSVLWFIYSTYVGNANCQVLYCRFCEVFILTGWTVIRSQLWCLVCTPLGTMEWKIVTVY